MKTNICFLFILILCFINISMAQKEVSDKIKEQLLRGIEGIETAKTPDDFDAALKDFESIVQMAPDWPDGHYYFGRVLTNVKGRTNQAINELNLYLELAPDAPDAESVKDEINKLKGTHLMKGLSSAIGLNVVKLSDGIYVRFVHPFSTTKLTPTAGRMHSRSADFSIARGDKIVSIGGKSINDMTLQDFLQYFDKNLENIGYLDIVRGNSPYKVVFGRTKSSSGPSKMTELEESDFEDEVLNSDKLVVSVFWTEWFDECWKLALIFDKMAEKYGNKIKFVNINVDENPGILKELYTTDLPMIIFYNKGRAVRSAKGIQSIKEIQREEIMGQIINKLLE